MRSLPGVGCAVFMALAVGLPGSLAAQTEVDGCTMKCGCISDGCGCQNEGGNGSACTASGNGCFVDKCGAEELLLVFAPDGSLLRVRATDAEQSAGNPAITLAVGAWEAAGKGQAVARDCRGVVVARYVDKQSAVAVRRLAALIDSHSED